MGMKVGVLLMAYGSPERLEDVPAYLLDIRASRPPSDELVREIRRRYALIGGRSPLLEITRNQAAALQAELNRRFAGRGVTFQGYVGMRHWEPRIAQAVEQMVADGLERAFALVMAPHRSRLSTDAYFARLEEACAALGDGLDIRPIEGWHDHPAFIAALAAHASRALERFGGATPAVIFTAHSLPARILAEGDPYERQLLETAGLVAARMGLPEGSYRFAYQSAGQSPEPWLEPSLESVLLELASAGAKDVLVVPIGFVCDHVEVLYDVDIACRELAGRHGMRLERSESLNAAPEFIAALAQVVSEQAGLLRP